MSNSPTMLNNNLKGFTIWPKKGISPAAIKVAVSGLALIVLAVSGGLAIAGWLMPLVAQSSNAMQSTTAGAPEPVRVASLNGLSGVSSLPPEPVVQKTETIVPRQSGNDLNPYALGPKRPGTVSPSRKTVENQVPLAVPPPVSALPPVVADEGLRILTESVVSTLENLKKKENAKGSDDLVPATNDLRKAIQVLVIRATSKGKSSAYVKALIDKAIAGRDAVPLALKNANGKLDTRLLLASVLPKKTVKKVGNAGGQYLAALENESRSITSADNDTVLPASKKSKPRKRRYILVRKGDNLSEIAMRVYGDPLAFTKIYRANRKLLLNPNILTIGQRLYIPR